MDTNHNRKVISIMETIEIIPVPPNYDYEQNNDYYNMPELVRCDRATGLPVAR